MQRVALDWGLWKTTLDILCVGNDGNIYSSSKLESQNHETNTKSTISARMVAGSYDFHHAPAFPRLPHMFMYAIICILWIMPNIRSFPMFVVVLASCQSFDYFVGHLILLKCYLYPIVCLFDWLYSIFSTYSCWLCCWCCFPHNQQMTLSQAIYASWIYTNWFNRSLLLQRHHSFIAV